MANESPRTIAVMPGVADDEKTAQDALVQSFISGQVSEQASNIEKLYGFVRSAVSDQVYEGMKEVYTSEAEGEELPYSRQHVSDIVNRSYDTHISRAYRDIIREEEAIRSRRNSSNQQREFPLPILISQAISAAESEGTEATNNPANWDLFTRKRREVMHDRLLKGSVDLTFKQGDAGGSIIMATAEGGSWTGAPTLTTASFDSTNVSQARIEAVGLFSVPFPTDGDLPETPI